MADEYLEKVAGELADLALADERRSADANIVDVIGEMVGASSQTLQEAFLTAVRVRRAEGRARQLLADRAAEQMNSATRLLGNDADIQPDQSPPETQDDAENAALANDDADAVVQEIEALITPARPKRR